MSSSLPVASDEITADVTGRAGDESIGPVSHVAAVFLCGLFAFLELYCLQPLLPFLANAFHASEAKVGTTISACTLGVAISAALLAMFGERLDRKRTIVGSMWALAIVVALTATAPDLPALTLWRFLQGLLTPGIFIITIAYVTEEWAPLQVPRVMSFYVAGTVFGGFVGRVAGGIITEHFGWRVMFLILAVGGAAGAMFTQKLLKQPIFRSKRVRDEAPWAPMLRNLKNRRLLATFGIGYGMLFTLVSLFSYITFYLASAPFFLSTTALSWLFSVYLVGLAATLSAGTILSRIGLRSGMLVAVGLCMSGVALTLIPSLLAVGIGLSLGSSGVFIAQTCANSFLRDAAPAGSRVSAAGLYICCYYVGGTVGGVLPGVFWKVGGWPGCTALIFCFLVIAGLLAIFGWRPQVSTVADPIPL